ncbi:hypothetical protein GCM10023263_53750 [Phytohabitans rumicis]
MLVAIVVLYVLIIAAGERSVVGPVRALLLGGLLVAATGLAGPRHRWVRASIAGAVAAFAVSVVAILLGNERVSIALTNAALTALVAATIAAILQALWQRRRVDVYTVNGALATYLLLALLYSSLHQFLAATLGNPYLDGVTDPADASAFLYFSVITLTTTGFGDIVPVSGVARAVVVTEAVVGQLYLVSVVAAVVGRWAPKR